MSVTRYITKTTKRAIRCEDYVWAEPRERLDVIIVSDDPIDTGLVDQHGTPIMRVSSRAPLGFCR
jgi:hypothetical protein